MIFLDKSSLNVLINVRSYKKECMGWEDDPSLACYRDLSDSRRQCVIQFGGKWLFLG